MIESSVQLRGNLTLCLGEPTLLAAEVICGPGVLVDSRFALGSRPRDHLEHESVVNVSKFF